MDDVTRSSSREKKGPSTGDEVEGLLAQFLLAREEGRPIDVTTFLSRHPAHAERLSELLHDVSSPPSLSKGGTSFGGLDAFEIVRHVSTAGGGSVYEARQKSSGQRVALKILDGGIGGDKREGERFRREAKMLRALDIIGVVPVLDAGEEGNRFWYAMKWIEGETLSKLRETVKDPSHRLHPMSERARLVGRCARILAAIHEVGILHRDIKPSNLMIDRTGEPVLIDFGIARSEEMVNLTVSGDGILGTPRYLAPESVTLGNEAISAASDQYGVGLVLWELCTGKQPFEGIPARELFPRIGFHGPGLPSDFEKSLSNDLEAVILRAIDVDPARRYASMEAFADDLDRVARGARPDPVTIKQATASSRWLRRNTRLIKWAAIGVVVLGAVGYGLELKFLAPARQLAARTQEIARTLGPWSALTVETSAGGLGAPIDVALTVGTLTGVDASMRGDAAMIPFLASQFTQALQILGTAPDVPTFRDAALRSLFDLLSSRDATKPSGTVNDALSGQAVETEARTRRKQLSVEEMQNVLTAAAGKAKPSTAADFATEALVRWLATVIPSIGAKFVPPPDLILALDECERRGGHMLASSIRGMVELAAERPIESIAAFDRVLEASPAAVGARYLRGQAHLLAIHPQEAVADLATVAKAVSDSDPMWGRLMGNLALAQAASKEYAPAIETLDQWRMKPSKGWQDTCIPHVIVAQLAQERGDMTVARSRLEDAIDSHPQWELPYDRLIELTRVEDPVYSDQIALEKREATTKFRGLHKSPTSLDAYLRNELGGVRPTDFMIAESVLPNRPAGK